MILLLPEKLPPPPVTVNSTFCPLMLLEKLSRTRARRVSWLPAVTVAPLPLNASSTEGVAGPTVMLPEVTEIVGLLTLVTFMENTPVTLSNTGKMKELLLLNAALGL